MKCKEIQLQLQVVNSVFCKILINLSSQISLPSSPTIKTLSAIAISFAASLALQPPTYSFSFKPNPLPSRSTPFLLRKPPFIIAVASAKSRRRESSTAVVMDSSDVDEEYEDDEDDGEDEEFVAFKDMRRWEMNKPAGFGEGKVYDTTVEEKLLEEMERERAAYLAAEKKEEVKSDSSSGKKQEQRLQKDVIPSGPSVRLGNLPKKKNIHRDLQVAFKGFNGIVNIIPAVAGNRKTRDPICKGFAFVEFVSEEAAVRFVNTYSKQDILFGKVQKKISCDIINPEQSVNSIQALAQPRFTTSGDEKQEEFSGMPIVNDSHKEPVVLMDDTSALLPDSKEIGKATGHLNVPPLSNNENESHVNELGSDNLELSFQRQRKQITSKKKVVKKKSTKTAKLSLPSSMSRLRIKERSVLTGVFTKYGGKVASASD